MVSRMAALALALLGTAVLPAFSMAADDVGVLVGKTVAAYGGESALKRAVAVRETGKVISTMRGGKSGRVVRAFRRPDKLRVEVAFPGEKSEVRVLDGRKGWRMGAEVSGPPFDAMVLQAARMALPLSLLERKGSLRDLGTVTRDGRALRAVEMPLSAAMTLTVEIDPESGRIVRSAGRSGAAGGAIEFVTTYDDLRKVNGVLFAFREGNYAMGQKTGETVLETVEVRESLPPETFRP